MKEDIKILEGIDVKFLLSGKYEVSNYIIDKADEINLAIENLLQAYKEQEQVIDEMGKELEERSRFKTKEEWKQYFINKVKENKE